MQKKDGQIKLLKRNCDVNVKHVAKTIDLNGAPGKKYPDVNPVVIKAESENSEAIAT